MYRKVLTCLAVTGAVIILTVIINIVSRDSMLEISYGFAKLLVDSCSSNEERILGECENFLDYCSEHAERISEADYDTYFEAAKKVIGNGILDIYLTEQTDDEQYWTVGNSPSADVTLRRPFAGGMSVAADIDYAKLHEFSGFSELPDSYSYFLCDEKGRIIYYHAEDDAGYESFQEFIDGIWPDVVVGTLNDYDYFVVEPDGVKRNVFSSRQQNGWTVVITIPYYQVVINAVKNTAMALALLAIGVIVIGILLIRDFRNETRQHIYEKAINSMARSHREIFYLDFVKKTCQRVYPFIKGKKSITGYPEAIEMHFMQGIIVDENVDEIKSFLNPDNIKQALKTQDYIEMKYLRKAADGKPEWCLNSITAADWKGDEIVSATLAIKSIQDVVDKEEVQRRVLELSAQNAVAANHAKSEFLSRMSHDIRTPINAILGMTSVAIFQMDDKEKIKKALQSISESGMHLLKIVNEVLDMSKIESGKMVLSSDRFVIGQTLEKLKRVFAADFDAKDLTYVTNFGGCENDCVEGDEQKLLQILVNIVSNAVKYTENGGRIEFRVSKRAGESQNLMCYSFEIEDNGKGMDEDFIHHIFEPFAREKTKDNRFISGTGLGMPIAYSLAKMMGGDIAVRSTPKVGSEFTVTVYLQADENDAGVKKNDLFSQMEEYRKIDFTGKRALIVDDNEMNVSVATEFLEMVGVKVDSCNDGEACVKKLKSDDSCRYDIIFMDIHMPKMDGYEATGIIRADERDYLKNVPIVAMTADAFTNDVKKALDNGMNGHISKPIQVPQLKEVLEKWL